MLQDHDTNGMVHLKVETVNLPTLATEEQNAMLDLQSAGNGVDYPAVLGWHEGHADEDLHTVNKSARVGDMLVDPEPFWHPDEHPCTWGGRHAGVDVGCCMQTDDDGNIVNATVTAVSLDIYQL